MILEEQTTKKEKKLMPVESTAPEHKHREVCPVKITDLLLFSLRLKSIEGVENVGGRREGERERGRGRGKGRERDGGGRREGGEGAGNYMDLLSSSTFSYSSIWSK